MDENVHILDFINKTYELDLNAYSSQSGVRCKYGGCMRIREFFNEIDDVFGFKTYPIPDRWHDETLNIETKPIYEYLSDCYITLGETNWLTINGKDEVFNLGDMRDYFNGKYGTEFLKRTYNNWYYDQINKKMEEEMKIIL